MPNKYLIKIAFLGAAMGAARSAGRIAVGALKSAGNQVHLATGGGFRDYAQHTLGVTDPAKLAKIGNQKDLMRHIISSSVEKVTKPGAAGIGQAINKPSFGAIRNAIKSNKAPIDSMKAAVPGIKNTQTDARVVTGALGVAGIYGAHKVLSRNNDAQQYQGY